eukprot:6208912-Pleurochrysis_carterae.AAC.1
MLAAASNCDCKSTAAERAARSHAPFNGKVLRCDCCEFGRSPDPQGECTALVDWLDELKSDRNEKGKLQLAAFISSHKKKHLGALPDPAGLPFTSAPLSRWVVDFLHVDLNKGKLAWKWALMRRTSAKVRSRMQELLSEIGLPLDFN